MDRLCDYCSEQPAVVKVSVSKFGGELLCDEAFCLDCIDYDYYNGTANYPGKMPLGKHLIQRR
jgi:hypothetical protein